MGERGVHLLYRHFGGRRKYGVWLGISPTPVYSDVILFTKGGI